MDKFMIGTIAFLLALFASCAMLNKANRKLETEKKAELLDLFSKNRVYRFIFLTGIIVVFLVSYKFELIYPFYNFLIYVLLLFGFMANIGYRSYIELKENDFPDEYIKVYIFSTIVRFSGLIFFITCLLFS